MSIGETRCGFPTSRGKPCRLGVGHSCVCSGEEDPRPREVVGFTPGRSHVPTYYRLTLNELDPETMHPTGRVFLTDVFDVIRAAGLSHEAGEIVVKAVRAGRMPGSAHKERIEVAEHAQRWALHG